MQWQTLSVENLWSAFYTIGVSFTQLEPQVEFQPHEQHRNGILPATGYGDIAVGALGHMPRSWQFPKAPLVHLRAVYQVRRR